MIWFPSPPVVLFPVLQPLDTFFFSRWHIRYPSVIDNTIFSPMYFWKQFKFHASTNTCNNIVSRFIFCKIPPKKNGLNLEIHEAIGLSWWREFPQVVYYTRDVPIKNSIGDWVGLQDVTKPLQWCKRPEETDQIIIERGDVKHPNKTNKPNRGMKHTLTKTINYV